MHKNKYLILITFLFLIITIKLLKKDENQINLESLRNQEISSIHCKIISHKILNGQGFLYYEKPNKFRLLLNLKSDLKLDIGSNDKFYWFWYKNFSDKLHYWNNTAYSDVILEFHPDFLKEIFNLNTKNSLIFDNQNEAINYLIINNQIIIKKIKKVNGRLECSFYNDENELLANLEILELETIQNCKIPKKIKLNSKKLGSIIIEMQSIKINEDIQKFIWNLPKINSINISK